MISDEVQKRPAAISPIDQYLVNNPDGPDIERINEEFYDNIENGMPEGKARDRRARDLAEEKRSIMKIYNSEFKPWSDPAVINAFLYRINVGHRGAAKRIQGLDFEDFLAVVLDDAGYAVSIYRVGNPGADLQVQAAFRNCNLIIPISLKSKAGGKTGDKIDISALSPHAVGGIPQNVSEVRSALGNARKHLDNYGKLLCWQAVESDFPDGEPGAIRYNMLDIPHDRVKKALRNLNNKQIEKALSEHEDGSLDIPIRDDKQNHQFTIRITKEHVGIVAINPNFYRKEFSLWAHNPELEQEVLDYQPSPTGRKRGGERNKNNRARAP